MSEPSGNMDPVKRLMALLMALFAVVGVGCIVLMYIGTYSPGISNPGIDRLTPAKGIYDLEYAVSTLDHTPENLEVKWGYELFTRTPEYIGPDNGNPEKAYSGNHLSCNNCHLLGGTKAYAAPLIGIIQRFPQYRGREDKIGTIEERINGCFERSMNGRVMPEDSPEMQAMIAYLNWLSRFAPEDGKIEGQGFVSIELPDRPVDLEQGAAIFHRVCSECHGANGEGKYRPDSMVYLYPPLWGPDSFNNGAGMNRVITAAQFIKANMPFGVTYLDPKLTDEEAYDVAGYINQRNRPVKANLGQDFPNLLKKPVSTPYPPYADPFSLEQHQLGPFLEIMEYYKKEHEILKTK